MNCQEAKRESLEIYEDVMEDNGMAERERLSRKVDTAGWVDCVGVDGKKHICHPQDETTKCGLKIARKKLGKTDWNRFSCYDCTY